MYVYNEISKQKDMFVGLVFFFFRKKTVLGVNRVCLLLFTYINSGITAVRLIPEIDSHRSNVKILSVEDEKQ